MTTIQICALISIIFAAAILYWIGYKGGLTDGRAEGSEEGKCIQQSDHTEAIRNLNLSLEQARENYKSLYQHYTRALVAIKLGEADRLILLAIADKLKLASDTFRAINSISQATQALALRDKAISMAALLEAIAQEKAA